MSETEDKPKEAGGRWGRRLAIAAFLLAGLVAALPAIVSHTGLGRAVLDAVAERLPAGSTVGGVSLSWTRPVGATGVVLKDGAGRELAVEEVRADAGLWEMLWNRRPPGRLTLRGIDVTVDLDAPEPPPDFSEGGGGDGSDGGGELDVPDIAVERLRVTLKNGPLREPVTLRIDHADVTGEGGDFEAAGEGGLVAGESVAPLTLEGRSVPGGWRGRLVVSGLDPAGVLSRLKEPPLRASGPADVTLEVLKEGDGPVAAELGLGGKRVVLQGTAAGSPAVEVNDLKVLAKGSYDAEAGRAEIASAKFGADLLRGELAGGVDVGETVDVSLDGRVELLGPAVALAGLPEGVRLSAVRFEPLSVRTRGDQLAMRGELSWPRASAYGLVSDDGRVAYELDPAAARVTLASVPVGDGRAVGTYEVTLGETPRLRFAGGPVLEGVTLTEELCRDWLRYVSPALSRATDVRGTFGLTLGPTDVALDGSVPAVAGRVEVGGATLRPGPVADQLLGVTAGLSSLGLGDGRVGEAIGRIEGRDLARLAAQSVPFAADAAGVSHEGFRIESGDAAVTTSGRVGYDETLDVVAFVELPARWTAGKPVLAALAAKPLRVPVAGTLDRPQLDRSALRGLGKRAAGAAAGGLIQKLLDR